MLLHSIILGNGKPVLILHGFLGMLDNWKTIGKQLADDDFQVHLIDQRNHGNSFHSDEFNYDLLADDVCRYCAHFQLTKVFVIGHSMGGKTAMNLAMNHPELIEKLVVVDIAPKIYPPHHADVIAGLLSLDLENLQSRQEADDQLKKYISDFGVRQFLLKNLYRENSGKFGLKCNLEVLSKAEQMIGESFPQNTNFEKPVLFLKGQNSSYIEDNDRITIEKYFPKASVLEIPNAGHWLHAENPKAFYEKLISFLKN
ncbi:MAG: alpha/beta fold hydrolase [Flavobacteriaceae bacterium]|nr:alpha/beta fold hydrolase [Flavobacteriaceae bacterium]MDZ4147496.1 alpha/beta fold hydrolase [Flavobacteriaceae bacterium]